MNPTALDLVTELGGVDYLAFTAPGPAPHAGPRPDLRAEQLRRAVALQRLRRWVEDRQVDPAHRQEVRELADESAERLRDHDAVHRTGRGPVPALDERWRGSAGAAAYVRQERAQDLGSLRRSLRAGTRV
ncbi:hypothetical protein [Kitasatospora sp. NPDC059571]|uniref:hypothetical protein n=1 Tax=Kitasatospora sp. NPDC059571 TaxID=3346871 RepID=UPI0036AB0AC5